MKFPLAIAAQGLAAIIPSFLGTSVDDVNRTVYTFSVTVPASAKPRVLVIVSNMSGATALATVSATWNAVAMNNRFQVTKSASQWVQSTWWTLPLAAMGSGVTANFVITASVAQARAGIAVYVLENCQSDTPAVTGSDVTGNPVMTFNLAGVAKGACVIAADNQVSGATRTTVWSAPIVEDYDQVIEAGGNVGNHSGGNCVTAAAGTVAVTATFNTGANVSWLCGACAFR